MIVRHHDAVVAPKLPGGPRFLEAPGLFNAPGVAAEKPPAVAPMAGNLAGRRVAPAGG